MSNKRLIVITCSFEEECEEFFFPPKADLNLLATWSDNHMCIMCVYAKEKVKAYYFWMLVITFLVERRGVGGGWGSKHCLLTVYDSLCFLTVHDSLRFLTVYDSLHFFKTYTLIIHLIKHNQTNVYNKYTEIQYMHFTMIKKKWC